MEAYDSHYRLTSTIYKLCYIERAVYSSANWRWYDALTTSAAVRAAALTHFRYCVATLGPQGGLFTRYSTGRLPFDDANEQVYELGLRTGLDGVFCGEKSW